MDLLTADSGRRNTRSSSVCLWNRCVVVLYILLVCEMSCLLCPLLFELSILDIYIFQYTKGRTVDHIVCTDKYGSIGSTILGHSSQYNVICHFIRTDSCVYTYAVISIGSQDLERYVLNVSFMVLSQDIILVLRRNTSQQKLSGVFFVTYSVISLILSTYINQIIKQVESFSMTFFEYHL